MCRYYVGLEIYDGAVYISSAGGCWDIYGKIKFRNGERQRKISQRRMIKGHK
jgi:hypothetical protein